MIKEAIDRILQLGQAEIFKDITEDGRVFTSKALHPVLDPTPAPLNGSTLTALVDFLKVEPDVDDFEAFFHIESCKQVSLVSHIIGANEQRKKYITVTHEVKEFPYGLFMPVEDFVIRIQTFFIQDATTAAILKIAGNVTHNATLTVTDDGVTQSASAKTGIARVENVTVPNPVTLRPYRTFLDVGQQPGCLFVFRMKQTDKGPECALFEADSGLWKLEAISEIKAWLMDNAPWVKVVG